MITLDTIVKLAMHEYGDFKDYDDANMIGQYRKMTLTEKIAIDIMFSYLCGLTFNEIILKYESQF